MRGMGMSDGQEDFDGTSDSNFVKRTDFLFQLEMQYNSVRQELSKWHLRGRSEKRPDDSTRVLIIMISRKRLLEKAKFKNVEAFKKKIEEIDNKYKDDPEAEIKALFDKFELITQIMDDAGLLGFQENLYSRA